MAEPDLGSGFDQHSRGQPDDAARSALIEELILRCLEAEDRDTELRKLAAEHPELASRVQRLVENVTQDTRARSDLRPQATEPEPRGVTSTDPLRIGPYRILETLGEGGMGTVYLAEQREPVRRRVALKLIKLGMDSKAVLRRFELERQALAMLDHSSIARVFDAGVTDDGRPYFAMEYVKGVPLTRYCDDFKLDLRDRLDLFLQICAGVQHAHTKGIIHRDLKPANILVTLQDGKPRAKIIDFGLARATDQHLVEATLFTEQGQIIGTPEYMSPEQAGLGGIDIDARTDVYSLGVVLYEMVTGFLPFEGAALRRVGLLEILRMIREEDPARPSARLTALGEHAAPAAERRRATIQSLHRTLRGDLDWLVLKALEKDRTLRYETASQLGEDVRRYLDHEPLHAGPPSAWYRARKFAQRYTWQVAVFGIVLTLLVVGGAAVGWLASRISGMDPMRIEAVKLRNIARVRRAVVFLQVETTYRHAQTGELLRIGATADGAVNFNFDGSGELLIEEHSGSGFVASAEGWIVCAAHTVRPTPREDLGSAEPQLRVSVRFDGQPEPHAARVLKLNVETDLAVIAIEPFPSMPFVADFPTDSQAPEVGTEVFLFGYPLGLMAVQPRSGVSASAFCGIVSRILPEYLQVDAALHPGTSGGPVTDAGGEVIGVATQRQRAPEGGTAESIGYVRPISGLGNLWPPTGSQPR